MFTRRTWVVLTAPINFVLFILPVTLRENGTGTFFGFYLTFQCAMGSFSNQLIVLTKENRSDRWSASGLIWRNNWLMVSANEKGNEDLRKLHIILWLEKNMSQFMFMEGRENRPLQKRERTGKEYGCFLFVWKTKIFKWKINYILQSLPRIEVFGGGKWQNGSSKNITQNREFVWNFATFARFPFGQFSTQNS